jgi:hypothetical protein
MTSRRRDDTTPGDAQDKPYYEMLDRVRSRKKMSAGAVAGRR